MRADWQRAAVNGDGEAISRLIAEDVNIDALDRYGQTALMLAALHGGDAAVSVLLSNGAKLDITAKYGLSALMLAVINHRTEIATQLVDAGADVSICGTGAAGFFGKTARDLAADRGLDALALHISKAETP